MNTDAIVREFGTASDFPEAAIVESLDRHDETAPVFLSLLERAADPAKISEQEADALFLVIHVLAELGDRRAFRPLLDFLSGDPLRVEHLLGDAITESLPQVLISVFDGDVGSLLELMNDEHCHEFVRDAGFRAWIYLVDTGVIDREDAHRYLKECYDSLRPATEHQVWVSWADAITLLCFEDLMPLVRSAYDDRRIENEFSDFEEFEEALAKSSDPVSHAAEMAFAGIYPFADTIGRFSNWPRTEDGDPDWDDLEPLPPPYPETVTNPFRHVGRNDPCPCGSGKKFKKCCLQ